jgi:hypothetical protein
MAVGEIDTGGIRRPGHQLRPRLQHPVSGWKLEQPEPGVMRWTTPAGRHYTTRPTVYEP